MAGSGLESDLSFQHGDYAYLFWHNYAYSHPALFLTGIYIEGVKDDGTLWASVYKTGKRDIGGLTTLDGVTRIASMTVRRLHENHFRNAAGQRDALCPRRPLGAGWS